MLRTAKSTVQLQLGPLGLVRDPSSSRSVATVVKPFRSKSTPQPSSRVTSKSPRPRPGPGVSNKPRTVRPSTELENDGTRTTSKKLLEPHVLSARLKKLCDEDKLDEAIDMLKNSPLDAQNVPVWNTMIWETMKAKHWSMAYKLYVDMKRRGHKPTTRTYQTMLSGLTRIEYWDTHTKQVEHAHSLYGALLEHVSAIKAHNPRSPELDNALLAISSYIKILAASQNYQKMYDVYYALDTDGPFAPNHIIFTAMFQALAERRNVTPPSSDEHDEESTPGQATASTTPGVQNASDGKLLWRQTLKASQKSPGFPLDAYLLAGAIRCIGQGRPSDQQFALSLVPEYLGLSLALGEHPPPARVELSRPLLEVVLDLCNNMRKHRLCLELVQQIMDRKTPRGAEPMLDRHHMEQALRAHAALASPMNRTEAGDAFETLQWMLRQETHHRAGAGPMENRFAMRIQPERSTCNWVLMACWKAGDWATAVKTWSLMTRLKPEEFMHGVPQEDKRDKKSKFRVFEMDPEGMASMARTAFASKDEAAMRQCLRMIEYAGLHDLLGLGGPSQGKLGADVTRKEGKRNAFYQSKLAEACFSIVHALYGGRTKPAPEDSLTYWVALKPELLKISSGKGKWKPVEEVGEDVENTASMTSAPRNRRELRIKAWERDARRR